MLSMTPIKNAHAAKGYYEKDNYYARDSKEASELNRWWGKGAQKLGLNGYVKVEDFEKLLEGKLPSKQQLGRITKNGTKHRPGYDLTFSAPKSASILAEVGGDHRIYFAHDAAVNAAMAYLEKAAINTRVFIEGEIVFERVDNLVVAMFRHDTSRELDPDTHTHCVVMNMVQREDGEWRSISSEALFDHKMVAGLIYRAHLAIELQKLGYEIERTHNDGRFEVKGISREERQHFSKRRKQIEERLEKEGWVGGKASAKVSLDTRKRSKEIISDHLKQTSWQQECKEINFDPHPIIEAAKTRMRLQPFKLENPNLVAQEAIQYAAAHLGEREAVFAERDLIREALASALGKITLNHIQQAIQQANDKGGLIAVSNDHWTTLKALKLEEDNICLMKEGQQQCVPMTTLETALAFMSTKEQGMGHPYTKGQRDAIKLILTTTDKAVGVQGISGSGKTTLLEAVKEFATTAGYDLLGLAPSRKSLRILQAKSDIPCMVLHRYLIELAKKKQSINLNKPLLIILDEASMVSSKQMNQLLRLFKLPKVRVVMLGDVKQLGAVEAGKPFDQLQKAGMKTAIMEEILRQKNERLKKAVYDAVKGKIKEAFKNIDITEEGNKDLRLQKIANEYLSYSVDDRTRTMVLVPANDDRVIVNENIREGLKNEGLLHGSEIQTTTLVSRGFTKAYMSRVINYSKGNIVRFNKSYKNLGIKAGDYLRVQKIQREANEMLLEHLKDNKQIIWNPEKIGGRRDGAIEVYQLEQRSLMAGDKIRWLRNQGEDFTNAQMADVLLVGDHMAEVRLHNNKVVTINLNGYEHKHWDYSFAYTVHANQGDENTRVLAHLESFRKKLTTQQAFYVMISRGEFQARLFVDNAVDCIKTLEKYTGEKSSALEALNKSKDAQNWQVLLGQDQAQKDAWLQQHQQIRQAKWQTSLSPSIQVAPTKRWDIEDIHQRLSERAEDLAKQLLGEPNHKLSSRNNLRFGKKGSLSVAIAGNYVGAWHSFESGEKGNLIQLIQREAGLNFKETLAYAGQFLGISPQTTPSTKSKFFKEKRMNTQRSNLLNADDKKAIARAVQLEQTSLPINGTLAERYLREHRGIQGAISDSFRYHPKVPYYHINENTKKINRKEYFPALIAIVKDQQNNTQAVQVIYLDPKTANKAQLDIVKRTYGRPSLGAVMINPGQSKVMLAEGPETGLSVAQAYPHATVLIALSVSNLSNVKLLPEQKDITICMDNDGDNPGSYKAVIKAARIHIENGCTVYLAQPDEIRQDFNDVLKLQGEEAVRNKIDDALLFQVPSNEVNFPFEIEEVMEWFVASREYETQRLADIENDIDTDALTQNELKEKSYIASQNKELVTFDEANLGDLEQFEYYVKQENLQLSEEDFSIEI